MAQLVEEVSVLVADKRRKEPREVPRPFERDTGPKPGLTISDTGGMTAVGLDAMLTATQMRGAVTLG